MTNPRTSWLILSVLAVCFTGLFAVEITFARTPSLSHYFTASDFYRALCVHVVFAMFIWLMTFVICLWYGYFPGVKSRLDKPGLLMGFTGTALIAATGYFQWGESYLNDYLPVIHHPVFWTGIVLFVTAFAVSAVKFFRPAIASFSKNTEGQLVFYSLVIAAIMLGAAAVSAVTTGQAADLKLYFQRMFWVPGHIQQFLNASILLLSWHFLVRKSNPSVAGGIKSDRWSTIANLLMFLSIFPMLGGFVVDPVSSSFKLVTVFAYGIGLGVPVLIHTVVLVRKMKAGTFAGNTFLLSAILYYIGVFIAYGGMKSDLRVTAHYHGVVTGLVVALMGVTYYFLKENKVLKYERLARLQPSVFAIGMIILIVSLFFSGHYGAPRKTFGFAWVQDKAVISYLNILAFGAAMSIIGGIMFIFYSFSSMIRVGRVSRVVAILAVTSLSHLSFRPPEEEKFIGKPMQDVKVFSAKGDTFFLSELIKKKPTVLSPVYTKCPHSCSMITGSLKKSIDKLSGIGEKFQVVSFSFDTTDTPHDLQQFRKRWNLEGSGWEIVSADSANTHALLSSIDFQIEWNEVARQYDHPNVLVVITPEGKISRYVYGIFPDEDDIEMALLEAKEEKTSLSLYEGFMLSCFKYDPVAKTYVVDRLFLLGIISGSLSISGMLVFLFRQLF